MQSTSLVSTSVWYGSTHMAPVAGGELAVGVVSALPIGVAAALKGGCGVVFKNIFVVVLSATGKK
jgi:hypothetical protein